MKETDRIIQLLWITFVATVVTGCASAPSRFYTLKPTAIADAAPAVPYAVLVGPVSIPALVDRPQFTLLTATNVVEINEFNRWAEPLPENIARVVAGDLAVLLGTPRVAAAPLANFDPTYRVTIEIQRFDSVRGQSALIEAVWVIQPTAGGAARSGHTVAREAVRGDDFDALAAAHSRALAKVSADIAAAIRAEGEKKP